MESYIYKDKNNFNTNMYKLMQEFKIKDLNSKWLITDIETNEDEIFNKEYITKKKYRNTVDMGCAFRYTF